MRFTCILQTKTFPVGRYWDFNNGVQRYIEAVDSGPVSHSGTVKRGSRD